MQREDQPPDERLGMLGRGLQLVLWDPASGGFSTRFKGSNWENGVDTSRRAFQVEERTSTKVLWQSTWQV